jgi:hypothetical protein
MERWFLKIFGGLTFYFVVGFLIIGWWLGPALLGYKGAFEEDMATSALPIFLALWMFCLPVFILIGVSIEMVLELFRMLRERIDLR